MDNLLQSLGDNYIWIIVVAIFIVFTVIGFFVDRSQNKKKKQEIEKEIEKLQQEKFNAPETENKEVYTPINIENIPENNNENEEDYNTKEMSKNFLKEDNYDLSNLLKESIDESKEKQEEQTNIEEKQVEEPQPDSNYDRNLEYLLREKETPKEEIESIDDFLQRTMREAYKPSIEQDEKETIAEEQKESEEKQVEEPQSGFDIDYEDTLPIPIQKEQEFSPLEVTVVDPEFYKEYAVQPEVNEEQENEPVVKEEKKQDIDFKPIEDAILESLGKLSEIDESKSE